MECTQSAGREQAGFGRLMGWPFSDHKPQTTANWLNIQYFSWTEGKWLSRTSAPVSDGAPVAQLDRAPDYGSGG